MNPEEYKNLEKQNLEKIIKSGDYPIDEIRTARAKLYGEVLTPPDLVDEMLDKLPPECWTNHDYTFLEPAAGDGNFVVEVLRRKMKAGASPKKAIETTYAIELQQDNVIIMKERIYKILENAGLPREEAKPIVDHNIVCHDGLTWDYENWRKPGVDTKKLF